MGACVIFNVGEGEKAMCLCMCEKEKERGDHLRSANRTSQNVEAIFMILVIVSYLLFLLKLVRPRKWVVFKV